MRQQESYWTYKGSATPEFCDLPDGAFAGTEAGWNGLSPGFRRTIWREALIREAKSAGLSQETIDRLRGATIAGSAATLDEYLIAFDVEDARRSPLPEDAKRQDRADAKHHQSEVQISAREAL